MAFSIVGSRVSSSSIISGFLLLLEWWFVRGLAVEAGVVPRASDNNSPCFTEGRIFAEYLRPVGSAPKGRLKLCACKEWPIDITSVHLAETEESCRASVFVTRLHIAPNGTNNAIDRRCVVTEDVDFNLLLGSNSFHLCSPPRNSRNSSAILLHPSAFAEYFFWFLWPL